MFLIAGLGNPGSRYAATRHNAGFMLVDLLAEAYGISFRRAEHGLWGVGAASGREIALLKPETYMNLSGKAVLEMSVRLGLEPASIVAAFDDCDLPLGKLRIRKDGGSGGHRGVSSLIETLGTREFTRVRLGVGRPPDGDIVDYVLSPFAAEELAPLRDMLVRGREAVETILASGIEEAMNRFNA